ncbi:MAG TPA: hypothetical protein VIN09_14285 [Chloroflexota bacterium]
MKRIALLLALVLVAATSATAFALDVTMNAENNSGQNGTVTLEPMGNQTRVIINVQPGAAGVPQPAHVHEGTCANLNPRPAFPLQPVIDGRSETVIDVSLETLQATQHAVNVHKSAQEASVYVSCGDIPLAAAASGSSGAAPARAGGLPAGAIAAVGAALIGLGALSSRVFRRR